jgi:hypothetical protein
MPIIQENSRIRGPGLTMRVVFPGSSVNRVSTVNVDGILNVIVQVRDNFSPSFAKIQDCIDQSDL